MRSLGKQTVRTHYQHIVAGVHDPEHDHTHETRQTVYERPDGTFQINYMSGKRFVRATNDGSFECVQLVQSVPSTSGSTITSVIAGAQSLAVNRLNAVIEFESGDRWIEIEDDVTARLAAGLTQTAVGHFYHEEERLEGRHPRRWFVLVGPSEDLPVVGKVALFVLPPHETSVDPEVVDCHITGYRNGNPYPEFAAEIEALAAATDLPITHNYMGDPVVAPPAPGHTPKM
ncbi:hypothetical protein HFN89_05720 [Rhizobium laguerreae]|nr:hypothetical protein [Rhizobium laguerreae]